VREALRARSLAARAHDEIMIATSWLTDIGGRF
jgi:hypothetical protein